MTGLRRSLRVTATLSMAFLLAASFGAPAVAEVSEQEARDRVEQSYGVEVLRMREGEIEGRPVWLVTFMSPAGDFNSAFMVSNLAIDRQTGDLVPSFRHRDSGYDLPGGLRGDKSGLRPDSSRGGPWR